MNYAYICDTYMTIDIQCDKNLNKFNEEISYNNRKVIYTVSHDITTNLVHVFAWKKSKTENDNLLFAQDLLYINNQRYKIYYEFDKISHTCNFGYNNSLFKTFFPIVRRIDNDGERVVYECKKFEDPIVAKKELNKLKKHKLIKVAWDTYNMCYTTLCEACHTDGSYYRDCGSGRVYDRGTFLLGTPKNFKNGFIYKNRRYEKIPEAHWDRKSFYNKRQFELLAKKYEPKMNIRWLNVSDFENWSKKVNHNKDFDTAFKECGNYWRDNSGNVTLLEENHAPVIGSYERVVSNEIIDWKNQFDFDKVWESHKLELNEIDENEHIDNTKGGAWRFLGDGQKVVADESIEMASHVNRNVYNDYEKVVSLGWHNAYIKDSVACPVCERTYELISAVDVRTPIQKLLTSFRTGYELRKIGK